MRIRPIRSESDYHEALHRVEELWSSPVGTPEGDELDVLISLVEAYEQEHYPIDLPTASDAINFRLEQQGDLGISVAPAYSARRKPRQG
jgi:HTH-type transcriptional regulator/antitoxin HigA